MTKTRQWTIFTAVAVIVVLAAGWFLLIKPQQSKVTTLKAQAVTQQQANQILLTQIASLQSEEKGLPAQQRVLQKFNNQVPNTPDEPRMILQLTAAAEGAGVDLVSITPGTSSPLSATAAAQTQSLNATPTAAGTVEQLPISLGITGTYANIESFFQSLERLPRALLVSAWSLCPDSNAPGASSSAGGATGAACSPPASPSNKTLPVGTLGGTLSATVFYTPPAGTSSTTPAAGATTTAPTTTTPSTTTTPAPTTSTPAATTTTPTTTASTAATPTAASTAPAN